jgi:hypothetical protein
MVTNILIGVVVLILITLWAIIREQKEVQPRAQEVEAGDVGLLATGMQDTSLAVATYTTSEAMKEGEQKHVCACGGCGDCGENCECGKHLD